MSHCRHLSRVTLSLMLGLPALLVAQETSSFSNVIFGSLCDSAGAPEVCVATRISMVNGDSRCVDNYETKPCTRYGFSFDYDVPAGHSTLAPQGDPRKWGPSVFAHAIHLPAPFVEIPIIDEGRIEGSPIREVEHEWQRILCQRSSSNTVAPEAPTSGRI